MYKVPIRVKPSTDPNDASSVEKPVTQEGRSVGADEEEKGATEAVIEPRTGEEDLEMWRDRALRLQAEMENYRKRQRRLAEEEIAASRERVIRAFLGIADDLVRVLNADEADAVSLRQGVAMTWRNLKQALDREGVRAIEAQGQPFDPTWHEAVGSVSHRDVDVKPQTVIEVVEKGYRLGERVLRPARVVVAV
jgi:molecular chaperone GrpE